MHGMAIHAAEWTAWLDVQYFPFSGTASSPRPVIDNMTVWYVTSKGQRTLSSLSHLQTISVSLVAGFTISRLCDDVWFNLIQ